MEQQLHRAKRKQNIHQRDLFCETNLPLLWSVFPYCLSTKFHLWEQGRCSMLSDLLVDYMWAHSAYLTPLKTYEPRMNYIAVSGPAWPGRDISFAVISSRAHIQDLCFEHEGPVYQKFVSASSEHPGQVWGKVWVSVNSVSAELKVRYEYCRSERLGRV